MSVDKQEPGLLATALRDRRPPQICRLYRHGIQIAGAFRDLKNGQGELHLRAHLTRSAARLAALVLGTLAT